eukprot:8106288-Alexandrium_andersonii.AAC.1
MTHGLRIAAGLGPDCGMASYSRTREALLQARSSCPNRPVSRRPEAPPSPGPGSDRLRRPG